MNNVEYNADELFKIGEKFCAEENYDEAVKFFEKAASAGYVKAMLNLANIYYDRHISDAIQLFDEAIKDDENVDYEEIFQRENDNTLKMFEWYKKAIECGDVEAMRQLAEIYLVGKVVKKNIPKAITFYEKAADLNNSYAMLDLAEIYRRNGDYKDISKAVELLQKAADLNDWNAMRKLAEMYRTGEGVEKDVEKADALFKRVDDQLNELLDGVTNC